MALITRISRLFKADFHAVLDQVEEPHMLLRQAIRDMEDELSQMEHRERLALNDAEGLSQQRSEFEQVLSEIEAQLDVCFESDEDDLARDLIKRKLQTQGLFNRVTTRLRATEKELHKLRKCLDENSATLESMRQKAELFAERTSPTSRDDTLIDGVAWNLREFSVTDNDIEVALLQEKKRRATT